MPLRVLAVLAVAAALLGCRNGVDAPVDDDVVARVGEARLTEADVAEALGDVPAGLDSATARAQVIEQWVQRELLVQEARAQGLDADPAVRQLLAESERATLESAALAAFFAQNPAEPDADQIEAYYQRHREDLALREPYVRLRHLRVTDPARAEQARATLQRALSSPYPDSLFALVAQEYAHDPEGALALSNEYIPEGRLLSIDEALSDRVAALPAGAQVAVVPAGSVLHVVQVVDRVREGAIPPLSLVRDELAERLAIQMRRDMEARLLQQLRSKARSQGRLDLPQSDLR